MLKKLNQNFIEMKPNFPVLMLLQNIDVIDFLFAKLRVYVWDGRLPSSGHVSSVKALRSQGHPQAACRWLHSSRNEVQEEAEGTGSQRTHGMSLTHCGP